MTARESVKNYASRLREMTNYSIREIRKMLKYIGPRPSGYENEKKAQEYVAESMRETADSVEIEEFKLAPKAFMAWINIDGALCCLSAILMIIAFLNNKFMFMPRNIGLGFIITATVLLFISFFNGYFEFLRYKKFLDPLFKKETSRNVICKRAPKGEVKRRIIFSGHIDSAYEWHFTYTGGGKHLRTMMITGTLGFVILLVVSILSYFKFMHNDVLNYIMIGFSVLALCMVLSITKFLDWKNPVPGANDNLTGCFASLAILKFMEANNIRFENTEVIAMTTGAGESGLRGAEAYAKKHANEDDVETAVVCIDTLADYEFITIYDRDMSGTVKNSPEVSALLKKAGQIAGIELEYGSVFLGSSDAAAFTRGDMKASCLAAMDPEPARYYHTRLDTADNLNPKTIELCIDIMIESAFLFDEQGLRKEYK